jgi:hypothetical protein
MKPKNVEDAFGTPKKKGLGEGSQKAGDLVGLRGTI